MLDHLDRLGVATLNTDRLPIVEVPLADPADLSGAASFLWEEGIYVTLAPTRWCRATGWASGSR